MLRVSTTQLAFVFLLMVHLPTAHGEVLNVKETKHSPVVEDVVLAEGTADVINTAHAISRVALAKPDVAEARLINDRELMIMALQAGQTDVIWWLEDGSRQRIRVQVYTEPEPVLKALLAELENTSATIEVLWQLGKPIVLGQVDDLVFAKLQQLKEAFPVLNITQVQVMATEVATLELEVKVYEINRRSLRQLGLRWQQSMAGPALGVVSDWQGGARFRAIGEGSMNAIPGQESLLSALPAGQYGYVGWASSFASTLQMMQERGEGRVLATPKLRVESGQSAEFLAGGEIPIPQITLQGATEVDFKNYGIYLRVAPVKLADGRIRTQVVSELSQPDQGVAVQGVPGLRTRRAETMVTVAEGETLVIAGLVSQENSEMHSGLPGVGNGLGRLLSNRDQQSQETELVVFITPRDLQAQNIRSEKILAEQEQLWRAFAAIGCTGMREFTEN